MSRHKNGNRTTITMRDVANLAGVSQSTVSRVLNPTSATAVSISEETKQSVFDAVKQLGYYPNLAAQSLRGQKTMLIAMLIADISNPYYHQMVRAIQDVARKRNYDVLIANSDHDPENEQHFIQGIIRRPVDGVILTPYHLTCDDIDALIDRTGVSVVSLGKHMCHDAVDCVYADDEKATYDATRWLIRQRRHKRIAYISVPGTHPSVRRVRGFQRAMKAAGLNVPEEYVAAGDFMFESGEKAMRQLLRLPSPPTAVIACNDLMALGCLEAAESAGFEVPSDVAVVGFDNIPEANRVMPKLTTIAQFPKEMGEKLATALFERIEGEVVGSARLFEVPCKLIAREST
jgi:DNA-binding LacI/PurR family transcriptional regulator